MICRLLLAACALCGLSTRAPAATVLFDFETDAEFALWRHEGEPAGSPVAEIARTAEFATSGTSALCFASPAWAAGMSEWPAFECTPPITDWSGYDRLVLDATNPTTEPQLLAFLVSDGTHATRDGLAVTCRLEPLSHTPVVADLSRLAERGIDPADIRVLHIYTERPPVDMATHLDRVLLLRPGEPLPTPPAAYVRALAPLRQAEVAELRARLAEGSRAALEQARDVPAALAWAQRTVRELAARIDEFEASLVRGDLHAVQSESPRAAISSMLTHLGAETDLRVRFEAVRRAVTVAGFARPDVVVGFATSMEKILPRMPLPPLAVSRAVDVSLARNEREAFQVIVAPSERDARQVKLRVTDLVGPNGARLDASNIDLPVVGYVETTTRPPYDTPHMGWWPDPILEFQRTADIAAGDSQAWWVRVHAPKGQSPGAYAGKLVVLVDGRAAYAFDLRVRVYGFTMPDVSPLPLAVNFAPYSLTPDIQAAAYPDPSWTERKEEWDRMLADHYLTYDSIYGATDWEPEWEILARAHDEGRLARFNLCYYNPCDEGAEAEAAWRTATIDLIRRRYEKAKALGIVDHAYVYGCDENPPERFAAVERAARILHEEFPDLLILTTTYDQSYSLDSVIQSMGGFCPLSAVYDRERADRARAKGKQVWWYICCAPRHPWANMFVEYPAIEGRLLMGAMTAKYRPDGFLYYQITIWNSPPIESGPYTHWDPRSFTTYNGDGCWTCVGPDGMPLPTVRLENFRDGLDDYAYVRILEATLEAVKSKPGREGANDEWIVRADSLLAVPETLVTSMAEYSRDPQAVYAWRNAIAEAIDAAPVEPVEPWSVY